MEIGLQAYLVLALITAGYAFASYWLFKRTSSWAVLLGLAAIYFWTLMGAWPFIGDAMSGFQWYPIGLEYHYLMEKMFEFKLNHAYVLSLIAYGVFCAGLFSVMIFFLRRRSISSKPATKPVLLHHSRMIGAGVFFIVLAVVFVVPQLQMAVEEDLSFYEAVRFHSGRWYSFHAFANGAAAFCLVFGYAAFLGAGMPRAVFSTNDRKWFRWAYPAALVLFGIYLSFLGNRNVLFTFFIFGLLYLLSIAGAKGLKRSVVLVAICTGSLLLGGWIRAFSWTEITKVERKERVIDKDFYFELEPIKHIPEERGKFARFGRMLWSNEMFAAHFSMFGVLDHNVEVEPAVSLRYLLASIIPSSIKADRPPTSYDLYASGVNAVPGQGYTIHHATGWYINGGWPGIFLGGLVMGSFWSALILFSKRGAGNGRYRYVPMLLPLLFVSFFPGILRNGPEAWKMILIEGMIIPIVLIHIMTIRSKTA